MNEKFKDIINRAINGEEDAYEELYAMTCREAYFIALSITKNQEDAQDILQDSYIKIFGSLDRVGIPEKFDGWVCRIVSNESKNYIKKKRPELFTDISDEYGTEFDAEDTNIENIPHEAADNTEKNRLIMQIINGLPDDQRLIVLMYYYREMKTAEIAEALDLPQTTVKYKLLAARKKIKAEIEKLEQDGTKLYAVPFAVLPKVMESASEQIKAPVYKTALIKNTGVKMMANQTGFMATAAGKAVIGIAAVAAVGGIAAAVIAGTSGNSSNVASRPESNITETSGSVSEMVPSDSDNEGLKSGQCGDHLTYTLDENGVLTISGTGMMYDYSVIGNKGRWQNDEVTSVIINEGAESIGNYAFYQCSKLTSISIPSTVKSTGVSSFLYSGLTSVEIPDGMESIGFASFSHCDDLESVTIADSVTSIDNQAFESCPKLKEITIPSSVEHMGAVVFKEWTKDQTIYMKNIIEASPIWDSDWDYQCDAEIVWNA